jgi:hypothetical protein
MSASASISASSAVLNSDAAHAAESCNYQRFLDRFANLPEEVRNLLIPMALNILRNKDDSEADGKIQTLKTQLSERKIDISKMEKFTDSKTLGATLKGATLGDGLIGELAKIDAVLPTIKDLKLKEQFLARRKAINEQIENLAKKLIPKAEKTFKLLNTKCSFCKKTLIEVKDQGQKTLFKCGRCFEQRYCSKDCQEKDWPTHKKVCVKKISHKKKESKETKA